MSRELLRISVLAISVIIAGFLFSGCNGDDKPKPPKKQPQQQKDDNQATILQVGDKLFNIPSPLETALLIKEHGGAFQENALNNSRDVDGYGTKFDQALNLGVYGADLAYSLIYGQNQPAFGYMNACKKLGSRLGISSAFYVGLIKRFEGNMDNKDSLLVFVSEMNKMSDAYLKENEREDMSSLILCGGWIETLHYAAQVAKTSDSPEIKRRIGEQKISLENLIGLMSKYSAQPEFKDLAVKLTELKKLFDDVEFVYTFKEPETDAEAKVTTINSESEVSITEEQLKAITEKIEEIRAGIIG